MNKKDFNKYIGNIYYFHRFSKANKEYEVCFEPCRQGFDVAIYERFGENVAYELVLPKRCVMEKGYETDLFGQMDRSKETWNRAMAIAAELMTKL